jgi:AcrR family transcriptional regulator
VGPEHPEKYVYTNNLGSGLAVSGFGLDPQGPYGPSRRRQAPARMAVRHVQAIEGGRSMTKFDEKSGDNADGTRGSDRVSRGARRKLETRGKLIEAARRVLATKGVAAATIAEIADEADVGFGSFYNHFSSKEEIAGAVVWLEAEDFGSNLDRLTDHLEDPALILCTAILFTIKHVQEDELWGWFLVRTAWTVPEFRETLGRRLARDIMKGVEQGRFEVPHATMTIELAATSIIAAMRMRLEARSPPDGDRVLIEVVLRILGFSARGARRFADDLPDALARNGLSTLAGAVRLRPHRTHRDIVESGFIPLLPALGAAPSARWIDRTHP